MAEMLNQEYTFNGVKISEMSREQLIEVINYQMKEWESFGKEILKDIKCTEKLNIDDIVLFRLKKFDFGSYSKAVIIDLKNGFVELRLISGCSDKPRTFEWYKISELEITKICL